MKWILLSAITFFAHLNGMQKATPPSPFAKTDQEEKDPDLFKKNDQIYAGHLEFLYWTLSEGGLDYALKMEQPAWSSSLPSYAQGRYETGTYGMDPGFRLGFHYFRAPHYWELKWQYTRMTNRGSNRVNKPKEGNHYLTGTWPQIISQPLTSAKSHLHFNYNVFDMLVDRVFIPNPHLRLRTIAGILTAWMDQDWRVIYADSTSNSTTIRNRWHYVGAGLKTGTMVDWYWTGELYMTALWNFSVLLGSYSNRSQQTTTYQPDSSADTSVPVRKASYYDTRPAFFTQMAVGPSWQKNFPKNRMELFAGFEANLWFNLQEVYRSTADAPSAAKQTWINSSALTLYGLTTRLTVDF